MATPRTDTEEGGGRRKFVIDFLTHATVFFWVNFSYHHKDWMEHVDFFLETTHPTLGFYNYMQHMQVASAGS